MKTVLLATGISKFDELLMEYLGKTYPGAFESVGYGCKRRSPREGRLPWNHAQH